MFKTLNIPQTMVDNLDSLGYLKMTQIQKESLPHILEGKDLIAQAKTGSGKTASFGIGLLLKLDLKSLTPSSLVLCPTRELADQVAGELRRLARFQNNIKILSLCGGSPMRAQMNSLSHGAHILVGTVGRVLDHVSKDTLDLNKINTVVLDEADRMLDMGFYEDIQKILDRTPKKKQTLLFSATFEATTEKLAKEILTNPITVKVDTEHSEGVIKEVFYKTAEKKEEGLEKILKIYRPSSVIIFANTKVETTNIGDFLKDKGFDCLVLNGDLEQIDRDEVMIQFSNKSAPILIATDVASRGLDIKELELVINYDYPKQKEIYTHRIGRTARAGEEGIAITLFGKNDRSDKECQDLDKEKIQNRTPLTSELITICLNGGKKAKLRKGDVLGAMTKDLKIPNESIGKINITDRNTYIAIAKKDLNKTLDGLERGKIKGKRFKAWVV